MATMKMTDLISGITPRQLIEKLNALPEEDKDLPIMTHDADAGEIIGFDMQPTRTELVGVEEPYAHDPSKTYGYLTNEEFFERDDRVFKNSKLRPRKLGKATILMPY